MRLCNRDDTIFNKGKTMNMNEIKTHDMEQGSPEWHAHRAKHFNASDAAAMLGISEYKTRAELLREKATGIVPEVDPHTQARFDRGHEIEALARTFAEEFLDLDIDARLAPCVCTEVIDGMPLSASLDGVHGNITWECKTMNATLEDALYIQKTIPENYRPQLEQGLMLSGAERCLFTASDGTREGTISLWYESDPDLRKRILAGWKQFAEDLANYQYVEVAKAPPVANDVGEFPVLFVQAQGEVTASNWPKITEFLNDVFEHHLILSPKTDQEFADAKKLAARLRNGAKAMKAKKEDFLAQTASIGELAREIDIWVERMNKTALAMEKAVDEEESNRKYKFVTDAQAEFAAYIKKLNETLGGEWMPVVETKFQEAVKGKRTYEGMHGGIHNAMADAKIRANEIANTITQNRRHLETAYASAAWIAPDFKAICTKAPEDFAALLAVRKQKHDEDERARQEAAEAKARADQAAQDQRGKTTEATHAEPIATAAPQAPVASTPPDNGATMKLGDINARLGFAMTADFLALLGFQPVAKEKNAKLYRECDFPGICTAIVIHVQSVAGLVDVVVQGREPASQAKRPSGTEGSTS